MPGPEQHGRRGPHLLLAWPCHLFPPQTFVNDVRIPDQKYVTLKLHDVIRFGYDILSWPALPSGLIRTIVLAVIGASVGIAGAHARWRVASMTPGWVPA